MKTRIRRVGNSLGLVIPSDEIGRLELSEGDEVEMDLVKKERISGFGILRGKKLKPFKRYHKDFHKEF